MKEIDVDRIQQFFIDSERNTDTALILVEFRFKDDILLATNKIFVCDIDEKVYDEKITKQEFKTNCKPEVMMDGIVNDCDANLMSACNLEDKADKNEISHDKHIISSEICANKKEEVKNYVSSISVNDVTICDADEIINDIILLPACDNEIDDKYDEENEAVDHNYLMSTNIDANDNFDSVATFMMKFKRGIDNVAVLEQMRSLAAKNEGKVVTDVFGVSLRAIDFKRLRSDLLLDDNEKWLNCEIINLSMTILNKTRKEFEIDPSIHLGNTFFFNKLVGNRLSSVKRSYSAVKKETERKIFKTDVYKHLFFPTNIRNAHWVLIHFDIVKKTIYYYDSRLLDRYKDADFFLGAALIWVHTAKRECDWKCRNMAESTPQQNNGYDCGVCCIMNVILLSKYLPLTYNSDDLPMFRIAIASALLKSKFH